MKQNGCNVYKQKKGQRDIKHLQTNSRTSYPSRELSGISPPRQEGTRSTRARKHVCIPFAKASQNGERASCRCGAAQDATPYLFYPILSYSKVKLYTLKTSCEGIVGVQA